MSFLATIGRAFLGLLAAIGRVTLFGVETISHLARPPYYPREFGVALLPLAMSALIILFFNNTGAFSWLLKPLGIVACFALTGFLAYEGWMKLSDAKRRLAIAENGFESDENAAAMDALVEEDSLSQQADEESNHSAPSA